MIEFKLAETMARRKCRTLQKISADTGISRTTLTSLYYGRGTGVKYNTIEILCKYFDCKISDLIDVSFNTEKR